MVKGKWRKMLAAALGMSVIASTLAGCGGTGGQDSQTSTVQEENVSEETGAEQGEKVSGATELEPMEITVSIWGIQEGFDAQNAVNDTIFNDLCEKFNVTITPIGVTWNDYQEKNKVWAASGSLPDIFCDSLVTDNNGLYRTWAQQGLLKEIPADLSAYPNLNTIMNMSSVKAVAIDGKHYMIPRGIDPTTAATEASGMDREIMYRKDWAAEAGYTEEPKTYEEFVEMLKAMKANHPEATALAANSIHYLATLALDIMPEYINEGAWVFENEQWIPAYASERVIPYIERMQKLYADGILDPDFMTQKDGDAIGKFHSGYACAILGGEFNPVTFMEANSDVENLSDALGFITPFPAEDGNCYVYANTPYWSESFISAAVDDAKLERILMILDYMYSHEYGILVKNGIEGVDWEEKDGNKVSLLSEEENLSDKYPITSSIGWLSSWFTGFDQSGDKVVSANPAIAQYDELFNAAYEYEMENCKAAPINFEVFLMSNEDKIEISSMGSEFVEKANVLIANGEDAKTGWEKIIDELNGKGLGTAIESVTAQAQQEGIQP